MQGIEKVEKKPLYLRLGLIWANHCFDNYYSQKTKDSFAEYKVRQWFCKFWNFATFVALIVYLGITDTFNQAYYWAAAYGIMVVSFDAYIVRTEDYKREFLRLQAFEESDKLAAKLAKAKSNSN